MDRAFAIVSGAVALLGIVWLGFQKPPSVAVPVESPATAAQIEAAFIRDASMLQEESRRGSDYKKFADQFARTVAAFHLTEDALRQSDERRRRRFEEAMHPSEAVRRIWELKGRGYPGYAFMRISTGNFAAAVTVSLFSVLRPLSFSE